MSHDAFIQIALQHELLSPSWLPKTNQPSQLHKDKDKDSETSSGKTHKRNTGRKGVRVQLRAHTYNNNMT